MVTAGVLRLRSPIPGFFFSAKVGTDSRFFYFAESFSEYFFLPDFVFFCGKEKEVDTTPDSLY